jgi:AAA15 family ATPase/GTPase
MRASDTAEVDDPAFARLSPRLRLLRCAALYGANASGKSNLVEAMHFARHSIITPPMTKDASISVQPFRHDESRDQPSKFEFYLFASGRVYGYQFSLTRREIVFEELTAVSLTDPSDEQMVFRREGHVFTFSDEFRRSVDDPKFLNYVAKGTRANQLFLNEAHERDLAMLEPVYRWFESTLVIIGPETRYGPLVEDAEREPTFKEFLRGILEWADTGIVGIDTRRRKVEEPIKKEIDAFRRNKRVRQLLQQGIGGRSRSRDALIEAEDGQAEILSLHFQHRLGAGTEMLDVEDESDGTIRLLDLAPMLYLAKEHAPVYVVDELDRSLHTLLAQRLIERFIAETGAAGDNLVPQLIFTTHDTNLLDCRRLGPESIWFAEKNRSGASEFYSLAEYKPEQLRLMCGSLEKGYLQGRFGGIPFLGNPEMLGWLGRGESGLGKK